MPDVDIGRITVDAINSVESSEDIREEEIDFLDRPDPVIFESDDNAEDLQITVTMLSDSNNTIDERREELKKLIDDSPKETPFEYMHWKGHLSVDSVDFPRNPSTARMATINARYLPWPEHFPAQEPFELALSGSTSGSLSTTGTLTSNKISGQIGTAQLGTKQLGE